MIEQQRQIVEEWRRLLNNRRAIILDTETTGLNKDAEVIELGIIDVSGKELFQQYFMPSISIELDATKVHGLTIDELKRRGAVDWQDKHAEISEILKSASTVIIWNRRFDNRVLRVTAENRSLKLPQYGSHCAMISYWQYSEQPRNKISLAEAARLANTNRPVPHEAIADCKTVLAVMGFVVSKHSA